MPFFLTKTLFDKYVELLKKEGVSPSKSFKFPNFYALKNLRKNDFYFAEIIVEGEYVRYYGGISPLRSDPDA